MDETETIYEFGPFRLNARERRLTRGNLTVPVPAKAFDALLVLIGNRGRLMEKEALMKLLWPDTFVDDVNLAQVISVLRKALGERPGSPQFIETIPRHGYRFVGVVTEPNQSGEMPVPDLTEHEAQAAESPIAGKRLRRLGIAGAVVVVLAVVVVSAGWLMRGSGSRITYTQLTHFTDSATAPVLSPDGRMLVFIRGGSAFLSHGQIYLKLLPNGEPVQLTHESLPKYSPSFSPDGSHVVYSLVDPPRTKWESWIVPVFGGDPRLLLANATGLTWIGEDKILFSEVKSGLHMAIVTANENRSQTRDVYVPAHERAMAHYSYLSPDRRSVLIVEMDETAAWGSCRLVPFDGTSSGHAVGPPGACTAAAWSPDGRWMYFSVKVNGESHLWRQAFPGGRPQQITFGPTEEEGVAVAPDGRSLITAVGIHQGAVWIHGSDGDRAISSQGDADDPVFAGDGRKIYYLLRSETARDTNELWSSALATGETAPLLTGFLVGSFDVSRDGKEIVFEAKSAGGKSEIWTMPLDHHTSPKQIAVSGGDSPFFGPENEIVFRMSEGGKNYLFKTNAQHLKPVKVMTRPISTVFSHSPDGRWAIALAPNPEGETFATTIAVPISGSPPVRVCSGFCVCRWSPDGRFFSIAFDSDKRHIIVPLPAGSMVPNAPANGYRSASEVEVLTNLGQPEVDNLVPGPEPGTYAYIKTTLNQNLYRLSIP